MIIAQNWLWSSVPTPPLLHDDALDPGATQPTSPTPPMPWRQRNGQCFIQQQLELEESLDVVEQAYQGTHRTYETQPPKDSKSLDVPVQDT